MRSIPVLALNLSLALTWVGCGPEGTAPVPVDTGGESRSGAALNDAKSREARKVEFLNRIRQADPQYQTVERALINENNELGLILSRQVEMDAIPKLMRSMLIEMAKEFPGEDLTVIAYAPSDPPIKLGTAHLNAQTRDMTYTPARP
jgi:hypothetical protein